MHGAQKIREQSLTRNNLPSLCSILRMVTVISQKNEQAYAILSVDIHADCVLEHG